MAKGNLDFNVEFNTTEAAGRFKDLFNQYIAGSRAAGEQANALLGGTVEKRVVVRLERGADGFKTLEVAQGRVLTKLDDIKRKYDQISKTQPGSLTSLRQQVNSAKQARDAIAMFGGEVDRTNRLLTATAKPDKQWEQQNAIYQQLAQQLRNLEAAAEGPKAALKNAFNLDQLFRLGDGLTKVVNIFQSLEIVIGALQAPVKAFIGALAELQAFGLTFEAIGQGAGGASLALAESSRIALGLGVNLQTVREGFRQLSPVVLNSGGELEDVSDIVESLGSRFAVFGLNADKQRRVLNGVIQAFSKGKLMAEELTQQISEADPAFKTDFANALFVARRELGDLGKTVDGSVKNLEELVKSGKITSDVLIKVIPRLSKASLVFGKLGSSATSAVDALESGNAIISQVEANIATLNQLSLERLALSAQPLVIEFVRIQASITDFITQVTSNKGFEQILALIGNLVKGFGVLVSAILSLANAAVSIAGAFAPFLNFLSSSPELVAALGLALTARLITPIDRLKQELASGGLSGNGFFQELGRAIFGVKQPIVDYIQAPLEDATEKVDEFRNRIKQISGASDLSETKSVIDQTSNSLATLNKRTTRATRSAANNYRGLISQANRYRYLIERNINLQQNFEDFNKNAIQRRRIRDRREAAGRRRTAAAQRAAAEAAVLPGTDPTLGAFQQRAPRVDTSKLDLLQRENEETRRSIALARIEADASIRADRARLAGIQAVIDIREADRRTLEAVPGRQRFQFRPRGVPTWMTQMRENQQAVTPLLQQRSQLQDSIRSQEAAIYSQVRAEYDLVGAQRAAISSNSSLGDQLNYVRAQLTANTVKTRGLRAEYNRLRGTASRVGAELQILPEESIGTVGFERKREKRDEYKQARADAEAAKKALDEARKSGADLRKLRGELQLGIEEDNARTRDAADRLARSLADQAIATRDAARPLGRLTEGVKNFSLAVTRIPVLGRLTSGFAQFARNSAQGFVAMARSLGPLQAGLILVTGLVAAYNTATEAGRQVSEEAAATQRTLGEAIAELGGATGRAEKPMSTIAVLVYRLGAAIRDIARITVFPVFNFITRKSGEVQTGLGGIADGAVTALSALGRIAASAALFAGIGALIGSALGPGAAVGAIVGGVVGALIAATGAANEYAVKIDKVKQALGQLRVENAATLGAVREVATGIDNAIKAREALGKAGKDTSAQDSKITNGINALRAAAEAADAKLVALKGQAATTKKELEEKIGLDIDSKKGVAKLQEIIRLSNEIERANAKGGRGGAARAARDAAAQAAAAKLKELGLTQEQARAIAQIFKLNNLTNQAVIEQEKAVEEVTAAYDRAAKATGRVTKANLNTLRSLGGWETAIKNLNDEANQIDFFNFTKGGRKRFDELKNKANELKKILEFLSKTKFEIKIEERDIQKRINDANIDIKYEEGPVREARKLGNEVSTDLLNSADQFFQIQKRIVQLRKEGSITEEEAARTLANAAKEYLANSRAGAAKIIESARELKAKADEARSSLQNLKLDKPGFFTAGERAQNAIQIQEDYIKAVQKVREQTGDYSFTPRLEGNTPDEILKQKVAFIEARREAEKLEKVLQQTAIALLLLAKVLAKISGMDSNVFNSMANDAKKMPDLFKDIEAALQSTMNTSADENKQANKLGMTMAKPRIGQIFGSVENVKTGEKTFIVYDNVLKKTVELTEAQLKQMQAQDKQAASAAEAAGEYNRYGNSVDNASKKNKGAAASTDKAAASNKNAAKNANTAADGAAKAGNAAQQAGQQATNAWAGALGTLDQYVQGLNDAGSDSGMAISGSASGAARAEKESRERIRSQVAAAGGDIRKAFENSVQDPNMQGSEQLELQHIVTAYDDYTASVNNARQARIQLNDAQKAYDLARSSGASPDEIQFRQQELESARNFYQEVEQMQADSAQRMQDAGRTAAEYGGSISNITTSTDGIVDGVQQTSTGLGEAGSNTQELNNNLGGTNNQLGDAVDQSAKLKENLNGIESADIQVTPAPSPRWAGGPVSPGITYRVNELGQEGFLSRGGDLSAISRPRNALWKPPGPGTVIPAHIMSQLNEAGRGTSITPPSVSGYRSKDKGTAQIASVIGSYLRLQSSMISRNENDNRRIQSHQAVQIGKLAKAVNDLVDKNWNVDVKVRNTGNATYLDALNRVL